MITEEVEEEDGEEEVEEEEVWTTYLNYIP